MKIPKLPNQDDFLLELQNNNYSIQTILNYARDLCIFATFLELNEYSFSKLDKEKITLYKGYLRNGDHLKDLEKIRRKFEENVDMPTKSVTTGYKGSKSNDDIDMSGNRPDEDDENVHFKGKFLDNVYRKVFGSLGHLQSNSKRNDSSGLDARSVNRMLSALRSFLKFRIDRDLENPIAPDAIKLIKADKKKGQVAQLDDLIKLIESPIELEKERNVGIRNRAMLELLFSTGMRISELINLNLDQLNNEGKLFIKGKGKKERFVYVTARALEWLDKYLEIRLKYVNIADRETSKEDDLSQKMLEFVGKHKYISLVEDYRKSGYIDRFDSPALFIPFSGSRLVNKGYRISTNYFQECIAKYRRKLGILIPTSAHSLRHGFATYLAENGANPVALQVLLGHESLNTTTRYVHASDKYAEETLRKSHPLR